MLRKKVEHCCKLGSYLQELFPDVSITTLRKWVKNGRVEVENQLQLRWDFELQAGNSFKLLPQKRFLSGKPPQGLSPGKPAGKFEIIKETPDYIIINKPEGLLSVDKDHAYEFSLHRKLKNYLFPKKVYVVHRLDKETSGLILFAKSPSFYAYAKSALKKREMKRIYFALVQGIPEEKEGLWDTFLYEDKNLVMRVSPKGDIRAQTHYQLMAFSKGLSLMQFQLITGRKNQIRVHCSHFSVPIVGDKKYGGKSSKRMMLHAHTLSFFCPYTQKMQVFTSPIPPSFSQNLPKSFHDSL